MDNDPREAIYKNLADHYTRLAEIEGERGLNEYIARARATPYSLTRAINALRENSLYRDAPAEAQVSDRIAEQVGRQPRPGCVYVPVAQRDMTSAVAGAGGFLVGSELSPGGIFVAALRAASLVTRLGVQMLPVTGNVTLPKITTATSTSWLATEASAITESQPVLGQIASTPKTIGAYTEISRQLLLQATPGGERFVLQELARAVAGAVDIAVISGSGAAGQPLGISGTAGVHAQAGAALNWPGILTMVGAVEAANALLAPERTAWAIAPGAAQILRARERVVGNAGLIMDANSIAGYAAYPSTAAGTAVAVFGDWSSVLLPTWSTLEIGTDPYGATGTLFRTGTVGLRAIWTVDVVVLRPQSFSVATAIT